MPFFPLPKHCHPDFTSPGVKPSGPVEIDWANPLAKGLQSCIYPKFSSQRDLVSGLTSDSASGTPTDAAGPNGEYRKYAASSDFYKTKPELNSVTQYSVVVIAEFSNFSSWGYSGIFAKTNNFGTGTSFKSFRDGSDTRYGVQHSSGFVLVNGLRDALKESGVQIVAIDWDGARIKTYQNGTKLDDVAYSASVGSGEGYIKVCANSDTYSTYADCYLTLVYDRSLADAEHASLARVPYQVLKPAVDVYAFWATAGGTTNTVTGSLNAILQKQGIAKQATLNAILQKQGLSLNSSVDALLQKSVDITGEIDAILQKLGITSVASIDALLQKSVTASASLDAILTAITSSTETVSIDAILKKLGITGTASLDSVLQKQGLNVSVSLSALLQKAVSLSSVIDAILQKTVTTSASLDAILTQAGSGSVSANFDAILRKTLSVNLSIDALLQKQDLTVYASLDALLRKRQTATASLDAILYGTASIAASLDALLKRTGVSITANLDAILTASSSFITPKNLVYVMAEDRIVTVLAEDRIVKVI